MEPAGAGPAHPALGLDDRTASRSDEFGALLYRDEDAAVVDEVLAVADERGVPPAQVALAWMLSNPVVTAPIVGVTKVEHLTDAVAALDLSLTDDEIARLEKPYQPHRVVGPLLTFGDAPSPGLTAGARCWGTRRAQGAMFWFRWKTLSGSYVRFTWRSRS